MKLLYSDIPSLQSLTWYIIVQLEKIYIVRYVGRAISVMHNLFRVFAVRSVASYRRKAAFSDITKTYLYNFDPLKPHCYIVKLGFTGVYIIFLISAQNIDCAYSLEPPRRGGSNEYHNLCFVQKYEKYQNFLSENFHFFGGKIFNIVE